MLKHVVMWQLKDSALGMDKPALVAALKQKLESLVGVVPSIRSLEVGVNLVKSETNRDLCLVSTFDDLAGLNAYVSHPEHLKVVEFVKQIVQERRAADFVL